MPESVGNGIGNFLQRAPVRAVFGFIVFLVGSYSFLSGAFGNSLIGSSPQSVTDTGSRFLLLSFGVVMIVVGLITVFLSLRSEQIKEKPDAVKHTGNEFFVRKFPDDEMNNAISVGEELWLSGITMAQTLKYQEARIRSVLVRGGRVRALIVDPSSRSLEIDVSRGPLDFDLKQREVVHTLRAFCSIQKIAPNSMEIRLIDYPMTHNLIGVDPGSGSGILYIANYPFGMTDGANPKFVIRATDKQWFDFYKMEFQKLWETGKVFRCDDI